MVNEVFFKEMLRIKSAEFTSSGFQAWRAPVYI